MQQVMEFLANLANGFAGWFNAGGSTFWGWVTGIIPQVVCLMTFMNSIIKLVGEDRVDNFASKIGGHLWGRYLLMPVMGMMFLCNPMAYSFGRFLKEEHKPGFYDAAVSFCHPITGLFPHANAGELCVYMGIAAGIEALGLKLGDLAIRYFLVGLVVIFIRGILTEKIFLSMTKKHA